MPYTLTSRSTVIGHGKALGWTPEPDQLFLQFFPTAEFATVRPRIEAMLAAAESDSDDHPYDAYPAMVALELVLRDPDGTIVSTGAIALLEGTDGMAQAPDEALRELGLEPVRPLLFISATAGQSLEDLEPVRHKGKGPRAKKPRPKRPPPKRHRRR